MNLHLYERPARGSNALQDITPLIVRNSYRDVTRAVGGCWTAEWEFRPELGATQLAALFESTLGCAVQRVSYGMARWEGIVYELRLYVHGVEYMRSLAPDWWHNRVQVAYASDVGERIETAWAENTASMAEYGEMNLLLPVGGATADGAEALRDAHLAAYAWPRTRMIGSLKTGVKTTDGVRLSALAVGFWTTLYWRYQTTTITDTASAALSTLAGNSEFVIAGDIDTNTLGVRCDAYPTPQRLGDLIQAVIAQGDAAGNVWRGGVYPGRKLNYSAAPTEARYNWRRGVLYEGSMIAQPELLDAGELIVNGDVLTGMTPPGGLAWDDPRTAYIDQVQYRGDGTAEIGLWGGAESTALLEERIRRGNI